MVVYLALKNYRSLSLRLGFTENDLASSGPDRFINVIFAWGDGRTICSRIRQHWNAGADHVCVQPVDPNGKGEIDEKILAMLSPTNDRFSYE